MEKRVCSWAQMQTGNILFLAGQRFLHPLGPGQVTVRSGTEEIVVDSPVSLHMSELLGVKLYLDLIGVGRA